MAESRWNLAVSSLLWRQKNSLERVTDKAGDSAAHPLLQHRRRRKRLRCIEIRRQEATKPADAPHGTALLIKRTA